ncbi:MAG: hypothetical protein A2Z14_01315 [Chloroflexi bacterium RBG_16_48_8]|nr:MAG: hypothetical protein A2Z14_01315 [Chloroflexi bacterium RBG_16_48_8]
MENLVEIRETLGLRIAALAAECAGKKDIEDMLSEQIARTFQDCEGAERGLAFHKQILETIVKLDPQAANDAMHDQLEAVCRCTDERICLIVRSNLNRMTKKGEFHG